MKVVVVGAGKMGLPLACQFADRGARVVACDVDRAHVEAINAGRCPIDEPGIAEVLARAVGCGRLSATTDTPAAIADAEVVVVIVPALLTVEREIDASILESVSEQIASAMRPGILVSVETTLPVGGTRRILLPVLERGGLRAGRDFDLAFSPERVKSQQVLRHLTVNPKVVGGVTPESAARAADFYRAYLGAPVINVGSLEAAEMVKLAGMVYRDVNIALANELARYAEAVGLDLSVLLDAVNSDGEAALLRAGIGVGGHCTPVYPYFLVRDAQRIGVPMTLAERGRRINDGQAGHGIDLLERACGPLAGRRALILGLAFRPQVREHVFSTAFLLRDELLVRGATVALHDPLYTPEELRAHGFTPGSLNEGEAPDALILNTAHREYVHLDLATLARRGLKFVLDGRSFWDPAEVARAGLHYVGIGRPLIIEPPAVAAIPIARPLLAGEEAEAGADVVRSGWVLQGPQVAAFEREFAAFVGAPHACAVSSGTGALHLALLAVGVGPGDEVVTVSHSYIATANSVRYCGARPVFVDIEPRTFNIDPRLLERAITPRTKAILCVHQMGMPCDLAAVLDAAARHQVPVVEDAACAAGSEIRWQGSWERIGKPHGTVACFSFHPRKMITTGDGGMVTSRDADIDRRIRAWRQHGAIDGDETFSVVGYNYRMTDVQAAIGREQLRRLPSLVTERRQQVERYRERLAHVLGLELPQEPSWARSNWQSYCVRLPRGRTVERIMPALAARGIATRRGIVNAHQQPAYADHHGERPLPESERARAECLILPLYPHMAARDVERVVTGLAEQLECPP